MTNPNRKGKLGEREVSKILDELGFGPARRGKQYKGDEDSPDIITSIEGTHWEVKRYKRVGLAQRAMDQAEKERGSHQIPVTAVRADHKDWIVSCLLEDLPLFVARLVKAYKGARDGEA